MSLVGEAADASMRESFLSGILFSGIPLFSERQTGPARLRPRHRCGFLISGPTSRSFLLVDLLSLLERLRGQGIGSRLWLQIEEEAPQRGCRGAWLDTIGCHAPEFCRQWGCAGFWTIEDYPRGHAGYSRREALAPLG